MKRIILLIAIAGLSTVAPAALAALKDPTKLVLRKTDFPAGARLTGKSGPVGSAAGRGYSVTFTYRTGATPNELSSSVSVFAARSTAVAMFHEAKAEIGTVPARLQLPKFGDEQIATFHVLDGARLMVRKGSIVWVLEWQTVIGTREMTRAEAIAEMKRYGAKQMRRVGRG